MKETEENYIRRKCLERLKDNPEAGVMDFQEGIYAGIQYDKNKYSEEEVLSILNKMFEWYIDDTPYHFNLTMLKNKFEQFKKK